MLSYLRNRWRADGGYREFLVIATPLVLSTASWSIQHFVDRVFLTWYSTEALAAAMPAGMVSFVIMSLFLGTATYVNTFVAQYVGAGHPERVGPAIWQGVYMSLGSGAVGLAAAGFSAPLFDIVGHDVAIRDEEVVYFRVLCYGIFPAILASTLSCFYSGRGRTWTVLGVSAGATVVNIALNYGLIFGAWGMPEWGIRGAAVATNLSALFTAIVYIALIMQSDHRRAFATLEGWRPDRDLFGRLLRFGGPNGLNFMLDILAFSFFILVIGRVGILELTATNLAFNINTLSFMPLIGAGIAVSTMVGQRLGRDEPDAAEYCAWTGFHLAVGYMVVMAAAYVLVPNLFLSPYGVGAQGDDFAAARDLAVLLLRIVAIWCVFDAMYMMFTAVLKGAGDTRYIMYVSVGLSWAIMGVPAYVAHEYFGAGIFTLWGFICAYIIVAGFVFFRRFQGGKWKSMRVIEEPPAIGIEEQLRMEEARTGV